MIEVFTRTVLYLRKNSSNHSINPRTLYTARITMYDEYSRPLARKSWSRDARCIIRVQGLWGVGCPGVQEELGLDAVWGLWVEISGIIERRRYTETPNMLVTNRQEWEQTTWEETLGYYTLLILKQWKNQAITLFDKYYNSSINHLKKCWYFQDIVRCIPIANALV